MRELFHNPGFVRLWSSGILCGALRWLELLAIGLFVLERTGSPLLVAVLTLVRMAPMLLFGIPAGALADRYDRRHLLIISLAVLALASAILAVLALTGRIAIWQVALGAFLNGMFWSTEFPVRRTMLGELVGPALLSRAMALESATSNATRMVGPGLGGVLLEASGLAGVYLLGALLYTGAAVLVLQIVYRQARPVGTAASLIAMLAEGWRFAKAERLILGALAVTVIVNLWGFAYITMVPVIGQRVLHLTPALIGVLMSTEGFGALLGALLVGRTDRPGRYTQIYTLSSLLFLLAVLAFALSSLVPLSFALILVCGIGIAGFSVMQSTILFLAAPAHLRSRLMGLLTVAIGAGPIGMLHVGLLANWLGAPNAVALIALEGLVALGVLGADLAGAPPSGGTRAGAGSVRGRDVEPDRDAFELGGRRRVARHHERVVAGHDVLLAGGEPTAFAVAFEHLADMEHDRERVAGRHVGVEVGGIRGDHDPAAPGEHAHELEAVAVAADQVQADAGRELLVAVVEVDPAAVELAHHAGHVLDVERHAQAPVAHVAAGSVGHLPVLQVEGRTGKDLEVADVVVVQMGDDHVLDLAGVDPECCQARLRVADDLAVAAPAGLFGKTRVDHEGALRGLRHPDEIVERPGPVVDVVAEHEVVERRALVMGVFDGEQLVSRRVRHGASLQGSSA